MSPYQDEIEHLQWRELKFRRLGLWALTVALFIFLALLSAGWISNKL